MFERIGKIIEGNKVFFLTSHLNPDGDAVGSLLAMHAFLEENGRTVFSYMENPIPGNLRFLPFADAVYGSLEDIMNRTFDVSIILDSTDWERTGLPFEGNSELRKKLGLIVNIDHHRSNKNFGAVNLVDASASSVGELIYDVITAMGKRVSLDVAKCVYTAIMSDTGCFTYSNTNDRSFHISEKLVKIGIRPDEIAEEVNENYPVSRLELLRMALENIEFTNDHAVGALTVSQEMFKKTNTTPDIIEGFIDYPRYVAGVKVAVLFRELPEGGYKVSFRSRDHVDVAKVAKHFGGGGHLNASGCTISGELHDVKQKVFDTIKHYISGEVIFDERRSSHYR